ncbi:MAG TPA: hypothetical protein VIU63_05300, partial [Nitrospira sp.]
GEIAFAVGRLQLSHERNRYHAVPGAAAAGPVDSHGADADNATAMPSLDLRDPGMPDLQFVLFVAALCTSNLQTINISENLRKTIFDRCWALVHTDPPPIDPKKRVLDLRGGTELTLEACASTIRSLLSEAGILTLVWDHPVSDPSRESTPAPKPLIERLGQLYPDTPDIVDPQNQLPPGHA